MFDKEIYSHVIRRSLGGKKFNIKKENEKHNILENPEALETVIEKIKGNDGDSNFNYSTLIL